MNFSMFVPPMGLSSRVSAAGSHRELLEAEAAFEAIKTSLKHDCSNFRPFGDKRKRGMDEEVHMSESENTDMHYQQWASPADTDARGAVTMGGCCCRPKDEDDGPSDAQRGRRTMRTAATAKAHVARERSGSHKQCPYCRNIISGTFFESHVELCRQQSQQAAHAAAAETRQEEAEQQCPHCLKYLDPCFADSHIEACPERKRPARKQRQQHSAADAVECPHCQQMIHPLLAAGHIRLCKTGQAFSHNLPAEDEDGNDEEDTDKLCIICFDAPKEIAFMPCGHFACCAHCTVRLTKCPVCRQDIDGRIDIGHTSATVCPTCRAHVHPTFYDSHREVCRLQLKQARADQPPTPAADASSPTAAAQLCILCAAAPREVATVPCGHFSMCRYCASTVKTCPVCCVSIRSVLPLYAT